MNETQLVRDVIELLVHRQHTLATAESLTGGLIGFLLTAVPGASQVYRGGVISYATDLKADLAGVSAATLASRGAVAAETAEEMASGVARRCGARWGLATTGVAGPEPQEGHPVGEVFVAVADVVTGDVAVERHRLHGVRSQIRSETADLALYLLAERLRAAP